MFLKCYFFYFTNQLFLLVLLLLAGVYIRSKFKSLIIFHMNSLRVDGIFNMAFRSLGVSHGDRHCLSPLCSFSLFSFLHSLNWGPIMENRIKSLCWFQFQRPSEIGLSRNSSDNEEPQHLCRYLSSRHITNLPEHTNQAKFPIFNLLTNVNKLWGRILSLACITIPIRDNFSYGYRPNLTSSSISMNEIYQIFKKYQKKCWKPYLYRLWWQMTWSQLHYSRWNWPPVYSRLPKLETN